jgi:hypothetical protein
MVRIRRRKARLFFSRMIKYMDVFHHSSLFVRVRIARRGAGKAVTPRT